MSPLTALLNEHRTITEAGDNLVRALRRPGPLDASEIGRLRTQIASLLRDHFTSEHDYLLSKLTTEDRAHIPGYQAVIQGTQQLRFAYSAHVHKWSNRAIEGDRAGYASATSDLVVMMKRNGALVEEQLYRPGFAILSKVNTRV